MPPPRFPTEGHFLLRREGKRRARGARPLPPSAPWLARSAPTSALCPLLVLQREGLCLRRPLSGSSDARARLLCGLTVLSTAPLPPPPAPPNAPVRARAPLRWLVVRRWRRCDDRRDHDRRSGAVVGKTPTQQIARAPPPLRGWVGLAWAPARCVARAPRRPPLERAGRARALTRGTRWNTGTKRQRQRTGQQRHSRRRRRRPWPWPWPCGARRATAALGPPRNVCGRWHSALDDDVCAHADMRERREGGMELDACTYTSTACACSCA